MLSEMQARSTRARNDVRQYDDLVEEWWDDHGAFAMLHSLAAARASLVPKSPYAGALLVDLGCGGGLLAPHLVELGYRHVGVDLTGSALGVAVEHGVVVVQGDVRAVPVRDGAAEVVCAGEILEHVADTDAVVAEACRILAPGGTLVIDTIASTRLARLLAVEIAERIPGAAPPGIHDPSLFVDRKRLVQAGEAGGVTFALRGLRPSVTALVGWKTGHGSTIRMVPTGPTSVLFQAWGVKRP